MNELMQTLKTYYNVDDVTGDMIQEAAKIDPRLVKCYITFIDQWCTDTNSIIILMPVLDDRHQPIMPAYKCWVGS